MAGLWFSRQPLPVVSAPMGVARGKRQARLNPRCDGKSLHHVNTVDWKERQAGLIGLARGELAIQGSAALARCLA